MMAVYSVDECARAVYLHTEAACVSAETTSSSLMASSAVFAFRLKNRGDPRSGSKFYRLFLAIYKKILQLHQYAPCIGVSFSRKRKSCIGVSNFVTSQTYENLINIVRKVAAFDTELLLLVLKVVL
jgi:hypothetical protein